MLGISDDLEVRYERVRECLVSFNLPDRDLNSSWHIFSSVSPKAGTEITVIIAEQN